MTMHPVTRPTHLAQPVARPRGTRTPSSSGHPGRDAARGQRAVVSQDTSRRDWITAATAGLLLVWWTFQQVQELLAATAPVPTTALRGVASAAEIVSATDSGSAVNTVLILSFALLGAFHLYRRRRVINTAWLFPLGALVAAYLVWALLTVIWSVDVSLTMRRYIQLLCVLVGSAGLGLGYYGASPRGDLMFARHVVVAGAVSMLVLWTAIVLSGDFDVLNPSWAAKTLGIGTPIIYPIGFATLTLAWMVVVGHLRASWSIVAIGFGLVSLVLIKGRFIAAFTILLTMLLPLFGTRFRRGMGLLYVILGGAAVYAIGAVAALGGQPALDFIGSTVLSYGTLDSGGGNLSNLESLTGRTPLWNELFRYFVERPWGGYGFGAFWNPVFMPNIWAVVGWDAPVAHNGYLDEALATGWIGLILFLTMWVTGLGVAVWAAIKQREPFALWVTTGMLLFLLCNVGDSLMQTYARFPFYVVMTALFTLVARTFQSRADVHVVLERQDPTPWGMRSPTQRRAP